MPRKSRKLPAIVALAAALVFGVGRPAPAYLLLPDETPQQELSLAGSLDNDAGWRNYKAKFLNPDGRIIDTGSGGVSHSEGQGYGMLLAVAANDRDAFALIWRWTQANLAVRNDHLFAWLFNPWVNPSVADLNAATDGDLLIAWALAEAGLSWGESAYVLAARHIAQDIGHKLVIRQGRQLILLPGPSGFSANTRQDGPVVNLSYWIFPALSRLKTVADGVNWDLLAASGRELIRDARFGPESLPPDWLSLDDGMRPALGLSCSFGYNALRIPLYLALDGVDDRGLYRPFAVAWRDGPALFGYSGSADARASSLRVDLQAPGYRAVAALTRCIAHNERPQGKELRHGPGDGGQLYFPATLQLLSRVAVKTRWAGCEPPA